MFLPAAEVVLLLLLLLLLQLPPSNNLPVCTYVDSKFYMSPALYALTPIKHCTFLTSAGNWMMTELNRPCACLHISFNLKWHVWAGLAEATAGDADPGAQVRPHGLAYQDAPNRTQVGCCCNCAWRRSHHETALLAHLRHRVPKLRRLILADCFSICLLPSSPLTIAPHLSLSDDCMRALFQLARYYSARTGRMLVLNRSCVLSITAAYSSGPLLGYGRGLELAALASPSPLFHCAVWHKTQNVPVCARAVDAG